ncbi:MAG: D-aminopeptidase [Phycisphaerales bacterium]|nr:D-aminopeptidase [Phycisphaerales bacterium]
MFLALSLAIIAGSSVPALAQEHGPPPVVQRSASPGPDIAAIQGRMKSAVEEDGFSGALLVVSQGRVIVRDGYGLANREEKIANTPATIFGIGSTPIDFTKAAILLLEQEGKLHLSDTIGTYLQGVPKDKQAITLEHLMTGASGLKNFHGSPQDPNPDHTWIDRAEAVRRILSSELLFEPGTGNEHSHSAFGLLAAIVELVSGQSYEAFLKARFFDPLGMHDTGFFGEPIDAARLAVGYGRKSGTGINAPPYWGKTSWLVMGSGGMTSTLDDLRTFIDAIRGGKILPREATRKYMYRPGDVLAGGDMHGYEILIGLSRDPGSLILLVNNCYDGRGPNPSFEQLFQDLLRLSAPSEGPPPFTIGVRFDLQQAGVVRIEGVVEGMPGQAAGLKAGDVIRSINGKFDENDPLGILSSLLRHDEPIVFEIERGGARQKISVTPRKRP